MLSLNKSCCSSRLRLWVLIVLTTILVISAPFFFVIGLQTQSGRLIESYLIDQKITSETSAGIDYYCLSQSTTISLQSRNLDKAYRLLSLASKLNLIKSHTNLLLSRYYCINQDYLHAIGTLTTVLTDRPENLLAEAELGFAYYAYGKNLSDPKVKDVILDQALDHLEKAGFTESLFFDIAILHYKNENYRGASTWLEVGKTFSDLPESMIFPNALMDLVFNPLDSSAFDSLNTNILEVDKSLKVLPEDFFKLIDGSSLSTRKISNRKIGMLFRKTDDAGFLVNIPFDGEYFITVTGLDSPPAPIIIGLDVDFSPVTLIELNKANNYFVDTRTRIVLEKGIHLIAVKLTNDANISGVDRNAAINKIVIEPRN